MGARLSASPLWEEQRSKYTTLGPLCWAQHIVPFQISTHPLLVKQYAAAAREHMREGPVTFLELGGGNGKFAYLCARSARTLLAFSGRNCGP